MLDKIMDKILEKINPFWDKHPKFMEFLLIFILAFLAAVWCWLESLTPTGLLYGK